MNLENIVKCPTCNSFIEEKYIRIDRPSIKTKEEYSRTEERLELPICRRQDILLARCICNTCKKKFNSMILVDVTATNSYSAEDNSSLVMLK